MISQAIRDFLEADGAITDKIAGRTYPERIPQDVTGLAVVLNRTTANREYSLTNELGIAAHNLQLDVYGDRNTTEAEVDATAELIRLRLSGYRGQLNDDVFCHGAFIDQDNDVSERPADGSDHWPFRRSFNFEIHVTQAVPTH